MFINIEQLKLAWLQLQNQAPLKVITSDEEYDAMISLCNELVDEGQVDPNASLYELYHIALGLVWVWEKKNVVLPTAGPVEVLKHLMTEHKLHQSDLCDVMSASQVCDILAGRRGISKAIAKRLGTRFNVDASAFL